MIVSVTFLDDATGEPIARSNVPVAELPDTFALETELDLAGTRYEVVRAVPQTKAEFSETGRLAVSLRKLEMLDPKAILFSLATICGSAIPDTSELFVIQEDDYRQYEFIAETQHAAISEELASIRLIHVTAAAGVGWRKIHVRERIPDPLPQGLRWRDVTEALEEFEPIGGVALRDASRPFIGSVAVRLPDDVIVWGVEESGALKVLCVENLDAATPVTVAALKRVADRFSLALVDWCRCRAHASPSTSITGVLGQPWDEVD